MLSNFSFVRERVLVGVLNSIAAKSLSEDHGPQVGNFFRQDYRQVTKICLVR